MCAPTTSLSPWKSGAPVAHAGDVPGSLDDGNTNPATCLTSRQRQRLGPELLAVPPQHAGVNVDDQPPARRIARVAADRPRVGHAGARREPVVRLAGDGPHRARSGAVVGEERRFMRMADESERAQGAAGQDSAADASVRNPSRGWRGEPCQQSMP